MHIIFLCPHSPSYADVFQSVPSEAQIAVIPKENSIFGSVVETYDLIRLPELGKTKFIRDEFELPIQHCLVVADGTTLNDIMHIYSHEQVNHALSFFEHKKR